MRRIVEMLAAALALLGGAVLLALVLLVVVSVTGRGLGTLGHGAGIGPLQALGPILGDFELVEAGIAFAIFAFLPICQLRGGHATVDVFTSALPQGGQRWLMAFWEVVLTGAILLLTWRLYEGFTDKLGNRQTTYLIQFPVWWAYGLSLIAAIGASVVALWCAGARIAGAATGRELLARPAASAEEVG